MKNTIASIRTPFGPALTSEMFPACVPFFCGDLNGAARRGIATNAIMERADIVLHEIKNNTKNSARLVGISTEYARQSRLPALALAFSDTKLRRALLTFGKRYYPALIKGKDSDLAATHVLGHCAAVLVLSSMRRASLITSFRVLKERERHNKK